MDFSQEGCKLSRRQKLWVGVTAVLFTAIPATSQSASKKGQLPEGAGKPIVQRACLSCHDLKLFSQINYDRDEWRTAVDAMVWSGTLLKKEEIPVVVDYLAGNFKGTPTAGVTVPGSIKATINEWTTPTANSLPRDCFFTNRGGLAWYAGEFANVLGRFDLKTQKFEEIHLRPGTNPFALVEHAGSGVQGTIYFTSRTGGFIGEFDPNKREVREFRIAGGKSLLSDVAFDPNGVVWFTMAAARLPEYPQGSKIGSVNIFSSEIKLADTPTRGASPAMLAVDSKGIPFFTEGNSPRIGSVDPVTMKVTEYALPNPEIGVRGLAITPDDVLWYTDYRRGYLGRFDPKTKAFREWPSPSGAASRPYAITHAGGIIWYSETGTKPNMLVRFDPKTETFQSWPANGAGGIKNLFAQPDGSLWFTRLMANTIAHVTFKD